MGLQGSGASGFRGFRVPELQGSRALGFRAYRVQGLGGQGPGVPASGFRV